MNDNKQFRELIARQVFRISNKIRSATPNEAIKLNSAILILNQAQSVADVSIKEARKLFSVSKKLMS